MAVKFTKGQICNGTISKIYVTRSTIYMESFILVSQSAQLLHYAALLYSAIVATAYSYSSQFAIGISMSYNSPACLVSSTADKPAMNL